MDIEFLTFTLAANGTARVERAGRYVEVISADYSLSLVLTDADGAQAGFARNILSGVYLQVPFRALDVINGATAQTVVLMVTDGSGGSRRQPGNVKVIDQSVDQTNAQTQFVVVNSTVSAAGGSLVGLYSATKSLTVRGMRVGSDTAGGVALLWGTGVPTTNAGASIAPRNKLIGGAAPTAQVRYGTCAAHPVVAGELPGVTVIGYYPVSAGGVLDLPLRTPIVVPAGIWLGVASGAANRSAVLVAEFEEQ